MTTMEAYSRLMREYKRLKIESIPYFMVEPLPENILECHFVICGPEDTPYEGGLFHGKLLFPQNYPFAPPAIFMITPSGRLEVNSRLCLSISDYHPESWNPAWTISAILNGLLSFMTGSDSTLGSMSTTEEEKLKYALESLQFNLNDPQFCALFPGLIDIIKKLLS